METEATENLSSITSQELKKRREAVDAGISTRALEGIMFHPTTLKILERYARGRYLTRGV